MTKIKFRISSKCLKFAQICSKHALKYSIFVNIKKGQKMAKWSNHFIPGKQFQKSPNGNPATLPFSYVDDFLGKCTKEE